MKRIVFFINSLMLLISLLCFNIQAKPAKWIATEQKIEKEYLGQYRITFYCNCSSCCGQWAGGPTSSGVYPTAQHTCACGEEFSFGTQIQIQELGTYVCEDRGVSNGQIDIFVNNHSQIPSWGLAYLKTYKISRW